MTRGKLKEKTLKLKIGTSNDDDFGPVINEKQFSNILNHINLVVESGAKR